MPRGSGDAEGKREVDAAGHLFAFKAPHRAKVAAVVDQLKARPSGAFVSVKKNTLSHGTHGVAYKKGCHLVDVSALDQVLEVDAAARVATVEGQVTMGQLVAATLEHR